MSLLTIFFGILSPFLQTFFNVYVLYPYYSSEYHSLPIETAFVRAQLLSRHPLEVFVKLTKCLLATSRLFVRFQHTVFLISYLLIVSCRYKNSFKLPYAVVFFQPNFFSASLNTLLINYYIYIYTRGIRVYSFYS